MNNESLGYTLHQLVFVLDHQSDEALRTQLNIGYSQFKILMAAKHKTGLKQNDIAHYLGQTEASVSRQIKLMKHDGLLSVQTDPSNRRARIIIITSKGAELGRKCLEVLEHTHATVFGSLSYAEQKLTRELLERLITKAHSKK